MMTSTTPTLFGNNFSKDNSSSSDDSDYAPRVPSDPSGIARFSDSLLFQDAPYVALSVTSALNSPTTTALQMFPMPHDISVTDLIADWCYDDNVSAIVQEQNYISW